VGFSSIAHGSWLGPWAPPMLREPSSDGFLVPCPVALPVCSNPAVHESALVAAAMHLPELWEALTHEAVPWVAMAAAATRLEAALSATAQRQHAQLAGSSVSSATVVATTAVTAAVAPQVAAVTDLAPAPPCTAVALAAAP
jgi:hypothetical protein